MDNQDKINFWIAMDQGDYAQDGFFGGRVSPGRQRMRRAAGACDHPQDG